MRIAVLCLCHKNPKQINMLVQAMKHPHIDIFIHVDRKADMQDAIELRKNVYLLPDDYRVWIRWGEISLVDATLNLLNYARSMMPYDYFWLISGQDFPIKPVNEIYSFFEDNRHHNFINLFSEERYENDRKRNDIFYPQWMMGRSIGKRIIKRLWVDISGGYLHTINFLKRRNTLNLTFFFGAEWWCLSVDVIDWILAYLRENPDYYVFFKNTVCPDECFFQTLYMNSPYAANRKEYLTYVNWRGRSNSPDVFMEKDFEKLMESQYLMARKFDLDIDAAVIEMLWEIQISNS